MQTLLTLNSGRGLWSSSHFSILNESESFRILMSHCHLNSVMFHSPKSQVKLIFFLLLFKSSYNKSGHLI